ncbi:MAG: HAD family hydrolase [Actinomycetota bacterium]|nr:HAD family hydrolase [Actinomycetota bacterium]
MDDAAATQAPRRQSQQEARWVCLDVGETLIDETRVWAVWADMLGLPYLTLAAAIGAIAAGNPHQSVFDFLGVDDWQRLAPEVERRYGGFQAQDLYPDALPALDALQAEGCSLAVIANQPAQRAGELVALGVRPDVMAMSDAMGVAKPDPAFFDQVLARCHDPRPADVAYVGDRVDNDVRPAAAAGLRAVWLRRGPWGVVQRDEERRAHLVVDSLAELVERLDEVWADD